MNCFTTCLVLFLAVGVPGYAATDTDLAIVRRDQQNFTLLANLDGFDTEEHTVITEDGYKLTLYRVIARNCTRNNDLLPILFWHGLFLSSDDCIVAGPETGQCYLYANTCRDVWAANSRGNLYSRHHVTYDPDKDAEFWNFSVEDIAYYDTPSTIDYILNTTGMDQLVFVGHSQAVAQLMLLCSYKPEYNLKISVGFGLSPTAWLDHLKFIVIILDGLLSPIFTQITDAGVNAELVPRGEFYQPFLKAGCGSANFTYELCSQAYFALLGNNNYQISESTMKTLTGHVPSGTSWKNFVRWGQMKKNGFTKEDFGSVKNLISYGQLTPPEFDLSASTMTWYFISSDNDYVGTVEDSKKLCEVISNATLCVVSDKSFGHLDYMFGKDSPKFVVRPILNYLETGVFECA